MADAIEKKKRDAGGRILDKHIATVTSVVKANPDHFFKQLLGNSLVSRDAYDPANISLNEEQKATKLYHQCGAAVGLQSSNFSKVVEVLSGYPPLDPVVDEMKREGEKAGLMSSSAATPPSQEGASKKELGEKAKEILCKYSYTLPNQLQNILTPVKAKLVEEGIIIDASVDLSVPGVSDLDKATSLHKAVVISLESNPGNFPKLVKILKPFTTVADELKQAGMDAGLIR